MKITQIILGYLKWHYSKAIYSLSQVWNNFLYFISEFFSLKLLFKNFFAPWKRMSDRYPTSFNLKDYFYAFMTNLIIRIVGMIMRSFIIIIGSICFIIFALLYPVIIISWLILPLIVIALMTLGLILIFK